VPYELGRALLLSEALTPEALARALYAVATEGVPLPRVLVALKLIDPVKLDEELARAEAPAVQNVVPVPELLEALPSGLCSRLLALPIRSDPRTGTVDVAVADARCQHAAQEIGFFLKAPVRIVRAPLAALERALDRSTAPMKGVQALAAPIWVIERKSKDTPMWGTPTIRPSSLPPVAKRPTATLELVESDVPPVLRGSSAPSAGSSMPPSSEIAIPLMRKSVPALAPPRVPAIVEEEEAPPTDVSPMSGRNARMSQPPPLPFPDASHVLSAMRSALDRDEVLHALLVGTRVVARKVALFAVKKEGFVGWRCTPEFADEMRLRETKINASLPSAFNTAVTAGHYLGPIFKSEAHAPLLAVMGRATKDVAITVVRVRGHATILVVADELGDSALGTQRMDELARAAGEALARILRRTRP
jgi:hypothetical protein